MKTDRGRIAAWVASWDDRERTSALKGLAEKRTALRDAFAAPGHRNDDAEDDNEVLAAALFLEYAERVGVCPLELHYLLGDAAAASMDAVLAVRIQMMLEDAARLRRPPMAPAAGRIDLPAATERRTAAPASHGRDARGAIKRSRASETRGAGGPTE